MTLEGFGNGIKQVLIFGCNIIIGSGKLVAPNDDYVVCTE